ncbi:MAG: gliding motility-associated ABC transporter substrate-binding protein GldG [Saprospirales bacterium]|nr:MAG: gliding motility-associated ABC transporter substrate-binding protein GldG [Saprospirales bacterium]
MREKYKNLINLGLLAGILILINVVGNHVYTFIDLTEDKRFTLTQPTLNVLEDVEDVVYVRVLLDGSFPAGFQRLRSATEDMLRRFRAINPNIEFDFEDPNEGETQEVNLRREELAQQEIFPVSMRVVDQGESSERIIYPYAIFYFRNRQIAVNLLENEVPGVDPQVTINNSISLLEYKFANAIIKLRTAVKPTIAYTEGQGEAESMQLADLNRSLRDYYRVGRINLDSLFYIDPHQVPLLIVARPTKPFSERNKFILDQYVMNGGRVLWMINKLNVTIDSVRKHRNFVPWEYDLNLEDLLFNYGVRINPDLVQDLECSRIPMVVGRVGSGSQMDLFPWYYYPLVAPRTDHPIVKALDRINFFFPSSIDTIRTQGNLDKTVLLSTSEYSRFQMVPAQVNFDILRYDPKPERFNRPYLPLAVLLEGEFTSAFQHRLTQEMEATLDQLDMEFKSRVQDNAMIVISDGDIGLNTFTSRGEVRPVGLNQYERRLYANKDFVLNSIEYLLDEEGILEARTRDVKLRLMNEVRARSERLSWQLFNIGLPVVFVVVFGLLYNFIRKRRFSIKS